MMSCIVEILYVFRCTVLLRVLQVMSLGFVNQTLDAIVNGIVESVKMAHSNMKPGHLFINNGTLLDASVNRSPSAYLNNPESERNL